MGPATATLTLPPALPVKDQQLRFVEATPRQDATPRGSVPIQRQGSMDFLPVGPRNAAIVARCVFSFRFQLSPARFLISPNSSSLLPLFSSDSARNSIELNKTLPPHHIPTPALQALDSIEPLPSRLSPRSRARPPNPFRLARLGCRGLSRIRGACALSTVATNQISITGTTSNCPIRTPSPPLPIPPLSPR